jgi:hypothetical protein
MASSKKRLLNLDTAQGTPTKACRRTAQGWLSNSSFTSKHFPQLRQANLIGRWLWLLVFGNDRTGDQDGKGRSSESSGFFSRSDEIPRKVIRENVLARFVLGLAVTG